MITRKRKIKKSQQSIFISMLFGFLILGFVVLLVFYNFKINQRRSELLSQIENLRKEIQSLEEKNTGLRAGISRATKESYWEERIREQGFVREGESQVVIVPSEETQKEETGGTESFSRGLLEQIKNFFARVIQW